MAVIAQKYIFKMIVSIKNRYIMIQISVKVFYRVPLTVSLH